MSFSNRIKRLSLALTVACSTAVLTLIPTLASAQPFTLGGDDRVDPDRFEITTFATGLSFPYGMTALPDGSILVGTGSPGSYFNTTGQIIRLVDGDSDGVSESRQTIYTGFPGGVTEISVVNDLVITTSSQAGGGSERISFLRMGDSFSDDLTLLGEIGFDIPRPWLHTTFAHAVRPAPDDSGDIELYFNLGSKTNFDDTTQTVPTTGLLRRTNLNGDSIYRVNVNDTGQSITVSSATEIATGLRNAAGIEFHPITGDLYFEDNGIDGIVDPNEPVSADELNVIPAADLGGDIEDFGFADSYVTYRSGTVVGGGIQPLVAFQPIGDPDTGDEGEGPAQIAIAPPQFPIGLNNGVFVGMHGRYSRGGTNNEENALVYADLDTGEYFHFIGVDEPDVGHLDGLLTTNDSLFLADLSPAGGLSGTNTGIIYKIRAIPLLGDMDGNGVFDAFDVAPFELALADPDAYMAAFPDLNILERGDLDQNGALDAFDVIEFEKGLIAAPGTALPEPSTLILLALASSTLTRRRPN